MIYVNNINKITSALKEEIQEASQEIGVTLLADMKTLCPVGTRTDDHHKGQLRRSLNFKKLSSSDNVVIKWGSDVEYATKIEYESKSYLRAPLRGGNNKITSIINKHLKRL